MPRDFKRSERVSGLLRRELAQMIQQEIKDPEVGFVSLSDVEVSRDLAHAKVYVTVFNSRRTASRR
jgi:ribosome-binding factor A